MPPTLPITPVALTNSRPWCETARPMSWRKPAASKRTTCLPPRFTVTRQRVLRRCHQRGIEVLVEIHSYFQRQIEIARQVDWVYDFALPPLVLQPLVENAVRHGVEPAVAGGQVWVRAVVCDHAPPTCAPMSSGGRRYEKPRWIVWRSTASLRSISETRARRI